MELVHIVSGGFMGRTVHRYPVPNLILDDEHPNLFQLLTKFLDIKADNAVIDIHVCLMVKHIQRTCNIDFQRSGQSYGYITSCR